MRLLIGALVLGGGMFWSPPLESWAWSSDRYHVEEALAPAPALLPALSIGSPVELPLDRLSVEVGPAAEKGLPASALDEGLDNDIETIDLDVPIVRTRKVDRHVQFFSFHIRDRFEQWLNRLERHKQMVQSIFTEFNLPLDLIFLSLVESGFNTNAVSRAKAVGPWQFIKSTGQVYGLRVDNWIDERRDPVKSTVAAAHYLRDLYHLFGSWPLAMAAYNAGERKVGRALTRVQGADFWDLTDTKLLKRETKEYVPRFLAATMIAKDPDRFGLTVTPQDPVEYEEVVLTRSIHLRTAAKAAGVSYEELKSLNPELKRDLTPPDPVYHLKVPVGSKAALLDNLSVYPDWKRIQAVRYQVRRGDTLPLLASRHGVTTEAILEANALEKSYKPRTGDWLLLPKPVKAVTVASKKPAKISR
jgi:membrane-bound lytic murein transglycosylase D